VCVCVCVCCDSANTKGITRTEKRGKRRVGSHSVKNHREMMALACTQRNSRPHLRGERGREHHRELVGAQKSPGMRWLTKRSATQVRERKKQSTANSARLDRDEACRRHPRCGDPHEAVTPPPACSRLLPSHFFFSLPCERGRRWGNKDENEERERAIERVVRVCARVRVSLLYQMNTNTHTHTKGQR
jgi:hypothetical protein